jgi:uncharacterized protein YoaH (UPF0181 family)
LNPVPLSSGAAAMTGLPPEPSLSRRQQDVFVFFQPARLSWLNPGFSSGDAIAAIAVQGDLALDSFLMK